MILTFIIMNAKETSKNEFIVLVKILSEFLIFLNHLNWILRFTQNIMETNYFINQEIQSSKNLYL